MRYEKEMKQSVTQWLHERGFEVGYELQISGFADVIGFKFGHRTGRAIPNLLQAVVELKLRDIKGVIRQAVSNKYNIGESWAAMPEDFCKDMKDNHKAEFTNNGIGLLSAGDEVKVLIQPTGSLAYNIIAGNWLREKFWRVHKQNEKREK